MARETNQAFPNSLWISVAKLWRRISAEKLQGKLASEKTEFLLLSTIKHNKGRETIQSVRRECTYQRHAICETIQSAKFFSLRGGWIFSDRFNSPETKVENIKRWKKKKCATAVCNENCSIWSTTRERNETKLEEAIVHFPNTKEYHTHTVTHRLWKKNT